LRYDVSIHTIQAAIWPRKASLPKKLA